MPEEDNFSQIGGARTNVGNISAPYAELSVYRNSLRLSCFGQDYVLPKGSIVALTKYRGLFSTGLRIGHNIPLYPSLMVFWVSTIFGRSRFAKLKERLEAFGYEVED